MGGLGLVEGTHYVRECLMQDEFQCLINDLTRTTVNSEGLSIPLTGALLFLMLCRRPANSVLLPTMDSLTARALSSYSRKLCLGSKYAMIVSYTLDARDTSAFVFKLN